MSSIKEKSYNIRRRIAKRISPIKFELTNIDFEKIGSEYGFGVIPKGLLNKESIVYSFGAGLDIHMDIEIANTYACEVLIFDPTPKSIAHVEEVKEKIIQGVPIFCDLNEQYKSNSKSINKLKIHPFALWNKDEKLKFYQPEHENHISHSLTNIQQTSKFIEVDAYRLSTIMHKFGHKKIDFLKIDIEGAEFDVVEDILKDQLDIKSIYIEYHFNQGIDPFKNVKMIQSSLDNFVSHGYKIFYNDANRYFALEK